MFLASELCCSVHPFALIAATSSLYLHPDQYYHCEQNWKYLLMKGYKLLLRLVYLRWVGCNVELHI